MLRLKFFLPIGLLFCTTVFASVNPFSGLAVSAGLGGVVTTGKINSNFRYTNLHGGLPYTNQYGFVNTHVYSNAFLTSLAIAYNLGLNQRFFLGFDGTYYIQDSSQAQSKTYPFSNAPPGHTDFPGEYRVLTRINPNDRFAFGISPGIVIKDRVSLYVNILYELLNASIQNTTLFGQRGLLGAPVATDLPKRNFLLNGFGLGLGVNVKLAKHWLLGFNGNWVTFGEQTMTGPSLVSAADEVTVAQLVKVEPSWVDILGNITYKFS